MPTKPVTKKTKPKTKAAPKKAAARDLDPNAPHDEDLDETTQGDAGDDDDEEEETSNPTFIVRAGMGAGPGRPGSYNYKVSPTETGDILFELFHDPTLTGVEGQLVVSIQMSPDEADELADMLSAEGGGVGPSWVGPRNENDPGPDVDDDEDDEALSTEELEAKQKRREARHGVPLSPGDALKKQGAPLVDKKDEHGQTRIAQPSGEREAARAAQENKAGASHGTEPATRPHAGDDPKAEDAKAEKDAKKS